MKSLDLDPFTFGDSRAAQALARILNEENNIKYRRSVSRFLTSSNKLINTITQIEDSEAKRYMINIFMDHLKTINRDWPPKVLSFSKNTLSTKIKKQIFGEN
jgi:hypothetical protein